MHKGFHMLTQGEARGTEPPGLVPGGLVYREGYAYPAFIAFPGAASTWTGTAVVVCVTHGLSIMGAEAPGSTYFP